MALISSSLPYSNMQFLIVDAIPNRLVAEKLFKNGNNFETLFADDKKRNRPKEKDTKVVK